MNHKVPLGSVLSLALLSKRLPDSAALEFPFADREAATAGLATQELGLARLVCPIIMLMIFLVEM